MYWVVFNHGKLLGETKVQIYNSFQEMQAGQCAGAQGTMAVFNDQGNRDAMWGLLDKIKQVGEQLNLDSSLTSDEYREQNLAESMVFYPELEQRYAQEWKELQHSDNIAELEAAAEIAEDMEAYPLHYSEAIDNIYNKISDRIDVLRYPEEYADQTPAEKRAGVLKDFYVF